MTYHFDGFFSPGQLLRRVNADQRIPSTLSYFLFSKALISFLFYTENSFLFSRCSRDTPFFFFERGRVDDDDDDAEFVCRMTFFQKLMTMLCFGRGEGAEEMLFVVLRPLGR